MEKVLRSSKPTHCPELIKLAHENNYYTPKYHNMALTDKKALRNDFKKFLKTTHFSPDPFHFTRAAEAFTKIFLPHLTHSKILSYDESVLRAELMRSSGILFKMMKLVTKKDVIDKIPEQFQELIQQIHKGVDVKTIWETCPKEEIRSNDKLFNEDEEKNKQRTFLCCDTLHYMVGVMLYSDQNDKLHKLYQRDGMYAPGMSIFHGGTDTFVRKLMRKSRYRIGNKFRCYDISAMEASINSILQELIYNLRNAANTCHTLSPEQLYNINNWYLANLIFSVILDIDGKLGVKNGKNPSGGFNTLDDNTLAVIFSLLYNMSYHANTVEDIIHIYYNLPGAVMGDDTILADSLIWDTLIEKASELGFTFKLEVGTLEQPAVPITEAKFLNFNFQWDIQHSCWIFQPNKDKLLASLFFNMKNSSWRLLYAKLCSLRIMFWNNPEVSPQIEHYIRFINDEKSVQLKAETQFEEKIPYNSLPSLYLTEGHITYLLYGLEEGGKYCTPKELQYFL